MELAVSVDDMEEFIKAAYALDGDGPLALLAYQRLSALYNHIPSSTNVVAVAKHLSAANASHEGQLLAYANACCVPAYSYFRAKFDNDLRPQLLAFKAAHYFSPLKVNELEPTATDIDSLSVFPF